MEAYWFLLGFPCLPHSLAISCCAALAHRWPIMPPYTAATVNCFTICLNN
ncbi:tail assembly protein [Escherichia coli FRIK920]|nr:tail assembly protein [Escherichia coli FRIK920]